VEHILDIIIILLDGHLIVIFWSLAKECSWGYNCCRLVSFHLSFQRRVEFPDFGLHIAWCLNISIRAVQSLHQMIPWWIYQWEFFHCYSVLPI
jgi:hypothetical protein